MPFCHPKGKRSRHLRILMLDFASLSSMDCIENLFVWEDEILCRLGLYKYLIVVQRLVVFLQHGRLFSVLISLKAFCLFVIW